MKLWVPGESSEALRLDVRAAHGDGEGGREGGGVGGLHDGVAAGDGGTDGS